MDGLVYGISPQLVAIVFPTFAITHSSAVNLCLCLLIFLLLCLWDRFLEVGLLGSKGTYKYTFARYCQIPLLHGILIPVCVLGMFLSWLLFSLSSIEKHYISLNCLGNRCSPYSWLSPQVERAAYFYGIHILKTLERFPHWSSLLGNGMILTLSEFPQELL